MINLLYAVAAVFFGYGCWNSIRYYKTSDDSVDQKTFGALWAGFVLQAIALVVQWFTMGFAPLDRVDGILMILSLSLAATLLLGRLKAKVSILMTFFLPLIFFLSLLAFVTNLKSAPFMDVHLMTTALAIHILLTFLGFSQFTVGFGVGMVFWIQEGQLKQHQMKSWNYRLPSLQILDGLTVYHVAWGYVLWAAGLILGTQEAYKVWNAFPISDPKILGSILVLFIYSCFFLLRWVLGMHGKKTMTLVMVGYFLALFTFLGVRLFLTTQHNF